MEEMLKGVIYKLTSPNNKVYVGQTINFENRCKKYKYGSFKGQIRLWNNCQKYNWNPIDSIEIIEVCPIDELDEREIFWINEYDSFINGLNLDLGGKGRRGFKHSDETKEKLRNINLGKKYSDETKEKLREYQNNRPTKTNKKISEALTGINRSEETKNKIRESKKNNPYKMTDEQRLKISMSNIGNTKRLGKTHSDETKNKISDTKKGVSNYSKDVKIICVTTDEIYNSQRDAANKLNLRVASILRVCNNERKSYKGLVFMYYEEYINNDNYEK